MKFQSFTIGLSLLMFSCLGATATQTTSLWTSWQEGPGNWQTDRTCSWEQGDAGERILKVTVPASSASSGTIFGGKLPVNLKPLHGKFVEFSVESKHADLSWAPKPYLGFKMMLEIQNTDQVKRYPGGGEGHPGLTKTDWRTVSFRTRINENEDRGTFCLGLQAISGTAWFKNPRYRIVEDCYKTVVKLPPNFTCQYDEQVTSMPRLRGCMSPNLSQGAKAEDLHDLASWGANVIRWQVNIPHGDETDLPKVRKTFDLHLKNLDRHLPQLRRDGLQVILDFHGVPGGRFKWNTLPPDMQKKLPPKEANGNAFLMFYNKAYLDEFVSLWKTVALHYKDEPIVVAYDLCNEPSQKGAVPFDYLFCQYEAAKAVRAIDPHKPIIIAANEMSSPAGFVYLQPLPLNNLIYQVHCYAPGNFTHQGINSNYEQLKANPKLLRAYPGTFDNVHYDKEELRKVLAPVRRFQKKYGARIYMGEFSAVRYAPGADKYIEDMISLLEEYGWDWTYHAFREWLNWSVEYDEDINSTTPATTDTKRKKILLKYFRRNQKRSF